MQDVFYEYVLQRVLSQTHRRLNYEYEQHDSNVFFFFDPKVFNPKLFNSAGAHVTKGEFHYFTVVYTHAFLRASVKWYCVSRRWREVVVA